MVHKFFDKNSAPSGVTTLAKRSATNKQLAEELHKRIIKKFEKRTVYSAFKVNIWGADLADMQLISLKKDLDLHYVLLIFLVNMLGLLL